MQLRTRLGCLLVTEAACYHRRGGTPRRAEQRNVALVERTGPPVTKPTLRVEG